jgi:hypothetical protein
VTAPVPSERWRTILDRIEHRQLGVGLRFWGPPLWLEVTMEGPDSDRWPVVGDEAASWNWQSNECCDEADALAVAGADDDEILAVVARYTIENLILNAVHEIGEWLRLDGERVFPAHVGRGAEAVVSADQGNGSVTCTITFDDVVAGSPPPALERRTRGPADAVLPSRFTYLPGTTIAYGDDGPIVERWAPDEDAVVRRSVWSPETMDAVRTESAGDVALIARDVHVALVSHEADRICRSFHVDGARRWKLAGEVGDRAPLSVVIHHAEP